MKSIFISTMLIASISISACNTDSNYQETSLPDNQNLAKSDDMLNRLNKMAASSTYLTFEKKSLNYNSSYQPTFNYTVANNSERTIIAYEIGAGNGFAKKIEARISAGSSFSGSFKFDSNNSLSEDDFEIKSLIFSDGELVEVYNN